MDAPSEKCRKCNWWTLLREIREAFEELLMEKQDYNLVETNKKFQSYRQFLRENILSMYSRSAHKVCKEHWEGKR